MGFREGTHHIAIVLTDDVYHKSGDYARVAKIPADKGKPVLEDTGLGEDYPSVPEVKTVLEEAKITPIFLVTDNCESAYQDLVSQLGRGTVVRLSLNSSNLVSAVEEGLENISFSDFL